MRPLPSSPPATAADGAQPGGMLGGAEPVQCTARGAHPLLLYDCRPGQGPQGMRAADGGNVATGCVQVGVGRACGGMGSCCECGYSLLIPPPPPSPLGCCLA
eukprot:366414-Chlamydomonas_euryale.AAC.7